MTAVSAPITERRERTFLVLAGIFLSAMTLLNVVGITRFIQLGPLALAVGVAESGRRHPPQSLTTKGATEDGATLPGSSKNTFSLLLDWQMTLTDNLDLQANASYVYASSRSPSLVTGDITGGFPDVPSSDFVNLSAGVSHNNGVTVSLFANNLLDDRNIQFQATLGTALEGAVMNRPRTIGLRAGYSF